MKRLLLSIITLLVLTVANAQAVTYYVATTGNDSNPGTLAQPFRTLAKGITAAANGDTVLVANGVYSGIGNWNLSFQGKNFTLRSQGAQPTASSSLVGVLCLDSILSMTTADKSAWLVLQSPNPCSTEDNRHIDCLASKDLNARVLVCCTSQTEPKGGEYAKTENFNILSRVVLFD